MRLLSALNRARAQRKPLPSPLPAEPQVPFEYLIRLYTTISGTDQLSPRDQATLVTQLQFGLREDGDHDAARNDIIMLLTKLRDREDVTYRTRTDVDAILASIDAETHPAGDSQPPGSTATIEQPLSPSSTSTLGDRPTPPEDTPPPSTTRAQTVTLPQQTSQRQTETARVPEKPASLSVGRGTRLLVGMAITAVILIVAGVTLTLFGKHFMEIAHAHNNFEYHAHYGTGASFCIVGAGALIIAIVVLVGRKTASRRSLWGKTFVTVRRARHHGPCWNGGCRCHFHCWRRPPDIHGQ